MTYCLITGVLQHPTPPALVSTRKDLTQALLQTAWKREYTDCVKILINHVDSIDFKDKDGYTLLHWAAKKGYVDITKGMCYLVLKQQFCYDDKFTFRETGEIVGHNFRQCHTHRISIHRTETPIELNRHTTYTEHAGK